LVRRLVPKSIVISVLLSLAAAQGLSLAVSTKAITKESGKPVPPSRIYKPQFTVSSPGQTATVSFLRDSGMLGGACAHEILVDREHVFDIRAGEYQTLYLVPGDHLFTLKIEGHVCPPYMTSHSTTLIGGEEYNYRILIPGVSTPPLVVRMDAPGAPSDGPSAGPPFEWDSKYSSPGASFTVKEKRRVASSRGTQVEYELTAQGFSSTEPSTLWWKRGASYAELPATIGEGGAVAVSGAQSFMIEGYVPGQAVDLALASGSTRAHSKTTPFPIEAREGSYWASVEILSDAGSLFQITFGGFQPGETVEITSQHKGDAPIKAVEASGNGEVVFPVLLDRSDRGTATAKATGSKGSVSIQYNVGKKALAPQ